MTVDAKIIAESPSQGKFERFSNWVSAHKKEIAIALLIIGIAALTFGVGALLAIIPLSNFTVFHFAVFAMKLFTYNGANISGLSTTGSLFFAGLGGVIGGGALAGFGAGMLTGIPSQKPSQEAKRFSPLPV
jgi:hypothetical protein